MTSLHGPARARSFALGVAAGWAMAPLFVLATLVRRGRTFHPCGPTFHATLARHPKLQAEFAPLADRLIGRALVRFSGALWKHFETVPDALGCAVRLRRDDAETSEPSTGDQDLLFATFRRPWTMPLSPLLTDVRDYLANDYFGVSPFDAGLAEPVYLRMHPTCGGAAGDDLEQIDEARELEEEKRPRSERLVREVERGRAALNLEVGRGPYGPWAPVVALSLERVAQINGEALRFRPFRDGRGIRPCGFVHALRVGVYKLSQRARSAEASA
jgi:hypothetical protein